MPYRFCLPEFSKPVAADDIQKRMSSRTTPCAEPSASPSLMSRSHRIRDGFRKDRRKESLLQNSHAFQNSV
jgi:hypothetical protein